MIQEKDRAREREGQRAQIIGCLWKAQWLGGGRGKKKGEGGRKGSANEEKK